MARDNFRYSNYTAMLRNKFHLKFKSEALSDCITDYLKENTHIAEAVLNADRLIVVYTLLTHRADFHLTYDNLMFLINRIEMMDPDFMAMEPEETSSMITEFPLITQMLPKYGNSGSICTYLSTYTLSIDTVAPKISQIW